MLEREDNSYNSLRRKSINQWLDVMINHDDIEVRGGVKVTKEYIETLNNTIIRLQEKNELKDKYLKKLKQEKRESM